MIKCEACPSGQTSRAGQAVCAPTFKAVFFISPEALAIAVSLFVLLLTFTGHMTQQVPTGKKLWQYDAAAEASKPRCACCCRRCRCSACCREKKRDKGDGEAHFVKNPTWLLDLDNDEPQGMLATLEQRFSEVLVPNWLPPCCEDCWFKIGGCLGKIVKCAARAPKRFAWLIKETLELRRIAGVIVAAIDVINVGLAACMLAVVWQQTRTVALFLACVLSARISAIVLALLGSALLCGRGLRALSWSVRLQKFRYNGTEYGCCSCIRSTHQPLIQEETADFRCSLRFNAVLGSFLYPLYVIFALHRSADWHRVRDRPFGVVSLINALSVTEAILSFYINVAFVARKYSNIFLFPSLGFSGLRLVTLVLWNGCIINAKIATVAASQHQIRNQLRIMIIEGLGVVEGADKVAERLEAPVRQLLRIYGEAHRAAMVTEDSDDSTATLHSLLRTYFVTGRQLASPTTIADPSSAMGSDDGHDHTKVSMPRRCTVGLPPLMKSRALRNGLLRSKHPVPESQTQPIFAGCDYASEEHLDWLLECAAEAQQVLKHTLVPAFPDVIEWDSRLSEHVDTEADTLGQAPGMLDSKHMPEWADALFDPGVKEKQQAVAKAKSRFRVQGEPRYEFIKDYARLAIHFNTFERMFKALVYLVNEEDMFRGQVVEIKNRFVYPTTIGWREVSMHVAVKLSNGTEHICELLLRHNALVESQLVAQPHLAALKTRLKEAMTSFNTAKQDPGKHKKETAVMLRKKGLLKHGSMSNKQEQNFDYVWAELNRSDIGHVYGNDEPSIECVLRACTY